jgi:hypothetical protein
LWAGFELRARYLHRLHTSRIADETALQRHYSKSARNKLNKAEAQRLSFQAVEEPSALLALLRHQAGTGQILKHAKDYARLEALIAAAQAKQLGRLFAVYTPEGRIAAARFTVQGRGWRYGILSAVAPAWRSSGAMNLLMDGTLRDCVQEGWDFDFGGSMLPGVANFFRSFGAWPQQYLSIHRKGLPLHAIWNR